MEQKIIKKELDIKGMTCTSCEHRIETSLKKLNGVQEVKASFEKSLAWITYDEAVLSDEEIKKAIEKAGYELQEQQGKGMSKDQTYNLAIGLGILLLAGYMIIKHTIGFNFIPEITNDMGYGLLFLVGVLTSFHCIAMCGGINMSQCVAYNQATGATGKFSKLKPSFMYNAGRVVSYTIIGGIVGGLGSSIPLTGMGKGIIAILSGIFMIIMGLNILNVFPALRKINPRMPRFLGVKIRKSVGNKGPFFVGLINGLMPCGPLQAMQIYALGTGSVLTGALSMFFFSIGTVPLMFGFGAISTYLGKATRHLMQVSGILVIVLGVVMAGRGFSLSGFSLPGLLMPSSNGAPNVATINGDVQEVTIQMEPGRYTPITVQKGIPVKWTIVVEEGDLNGCNNPVTIPKYDLQKELVVGENVIEFTPEETGNITYTCWMGMIRSNIKVVDNLEDVEATDGSINADDYLQDLNASTTTSGGCCASAALAPDFANGNIPTEDIQVAKIEEGKQVVTVTVTDQGYSPAAFVIQKGIETKVVFNAEKLNNCNNIVYFPEFQGSLDLQQEDQRETPWLVPQGDFTIQCWMGMLNGYFKAVDDINDVDLDAIRAEIDAYVPTAGAGGGGCCGQ